MIKLRWLFVSLLSISACTLINTRQPGVGENIGWNEIEGWQQDEHAQAWPALLRNCIALSTKTEWQDICKFAQNLDSPSDEQARLFFENWFTPYPLYGKGGKQSGLITGYYEPLLFGSRTKKSGYTYPLYGQPPSLLTIDLGDLYPELKNKRVRGRLDGNSIVPFYSRQQIENNRDLLKGHEIVWINNRDDVFFLHIQGSGRVQLDDGSIIGVGYRNQNGQPYVAIGRLLIEWGEMDREDVSLFSIRQWLADNPDRAEELLNSNPSYVFFELRDDVGDGAIGSLNVPLTAQRSIAIDPKVVKLGTPIWLSTNLPGDEETPYKRLVIAQDTGGAIKGPVRADLFWGHGTEAEAAAGIMKESAMMIVLLPKSAELNE